MFEALCRELSVVPRGSCARMMSDIIEKLSRDPRPVFIDEADYLVDSKRMTESLRDLHDMTGVPIVLIGMGGFEQKIAHRKQLTGRILTHVRFEPVDAADARILADQLCDVKVRDDLLDRVHRASKGSVRLTVVSLARIEQRAKAMNLADIGSAEWGAKDDSFFTGEAPSAPASGKVSALRQ
jgi:DNA transposition AAA+ family ATPase